MSPHVYSFVLKGGFFLYEQTLVIETAKGLVVITSCAHPGIVPILKEAGSTLIYQSSSPLSFNLVTKA